MPKKLFYGLLFSVLIAATPTLYAQCSDTTTAHLAVHHLTRLSATQVDSLGGTQTVGDYWEDWNSYVESAE
jgi:hypothetical protein